MALTDLHDDIAKQQTITAEANRCIWQTTVSPLVTPELVEEHRRQPIGRHNPVLDMVLTFIRSDPVPTAPRLVIVTLVPERQWAIGRHSRRRADPIYVEPEIYTSVSEIEHAIFLRRLETVTRTYAGGRVS